MKTFTRDGLRNDGVVVVGVVARVEEVVVQHPMQPVVEELHRPYMKHNCPNDAVRPPPRQMMRLLYVCVSDIE